MDIECLRGLRICKCLPILYGWIILYRISASCCSIITGWVFADTFSLIIDNMLAFFYARS